MFKVNIVTPMRYHTVRY